MEEKTLNKLYTHSEYWQKRLLNIKDLAKDYIDIEKFDIYDKEIETDDKASQFFKKCQEKKIMDERRINDFKIIRKETTITFGNFNV